MDEYSLRPLQKKILEIIKYVDNLCKENNITYYLSGGCALGAIRNNGFIPWDDDLDIFMTSSNYYKFINVCKTQLDNSLFYLQEENTEEWPLCFSKLRMNGTTYIEGYNQDLDMHKGIFIDIYRLDNVSNNKLISYYQFFCAKLLIARLLPRINYNTTNIVKKSIINISRIFPKSFDIFLHNQVRKFNHKKTKEVANFFHRGTFKSNRFPLGWLGESRYIEFENMYLPVPQKVERYLERRFGNYLEIPKESKKKVSPHAIFFNTELDYSIIEKNNKDY